MYNWCRKIVNATGLVASEYFHMVWISIIKVYENSTTKLHK